jgi:hypothetical protein
MPVYQYKGLHYDLPDGLSNEQALSKIKSHVGESGNFVTKAFSEAADATTLGNAIPGAAEALAGGIGSMANMAVAGIAGPIKSMFTDQSAADEIGNVSKAIEDTIPYMPETKSGKAYLNLLSIPPEAIHKVGEMAYEKTQSPLVGAGVETLGNAALIALGGIKRSKKPATEFDAKLNEAFKPPVDVKESFDVPPVMSEGKPVTGKGLKEAAKRDAATAQRLEAAIQKQNPSQDVMNVTREGQAYPAEAEQFRNVYEQPKPALDPRAQQMALPFDEQPGNFQHPSSLIGEGMGRVDENGMPINAGRSIEAQQLENPLQRNLWGDELPQQHPQEAARGITEAIDSLPDLPWKGSERDAALARLEGELSSPELNKAVAEANKAADSLSLKDATANLLDAIAERVGTKQNMMPGEPLEKAMRDFARSLFDAGHTVYADAVREAKRILGEKWEQSRDAFAKAYSGLNFHYGDGGIAHDTKRSRMTGGRSTGHFGTGTYFLGTVKGASQGAMDTRANRPVKSLNLDNLNLFKARDTQSARNLHMGLREVNDLAKNKVPLDFESPISPAHKALFNLSLELGFSKKSKIEEAIKAEVAAERNGLPDSEIRSASTRVMQRLGYDGVDVRKTGLDNEDFGSVIYPKADAAINTAQRPVFNPGRGPGGRQRGSIDPDLLTLGLNRVVGKFQEKQKAKQDIIEGITGKKLFADAPTPEGVIQEALSHGKDSKGVNVMEAGSSLTAVKRNSPLILGGSRIIQRAKNIAEDAIRSSVFPTEKRLRALTQDEIVQLSKVMKAEMFNKRELSTTELAGLGLSTKQLLAYEATRDMFKKALESENAARIAQGKKPVSPQEAYLSSRWQGDFRRGIVDKEGKLSWYLAANSKRGLDLQTKALLEKFPELKVGKDHTTRSMQGTNMNAAEMYSQMVDVLGRDDPAVARIKEWVEELAVNEGRRMLAQEKHFKNKSNVRGFVGDRPSNTFFGKLDPKQEALALFQEQINYSKNAHRWSSMQEAGQQLKKVFSNEELVKQQPNNMSYLKDYYRDQIGFGTSKAVAGLEDAVKQTGVSPKVVNEGIGDVKNLWITQKLALSAGFMVSNVIQAANMAPHIMDMTIKYKGNPLYAIPIGVTSGTMMALGHISLARGNKGFYKIMAGLPEASSKFLASAMKYAEDNSVTSRSIYDETPVASSFSKTALATNIAGKSLTLPETFLRSISFMTYANLLKSSGKFKNDMEIFRLAEERTNISMADYRTGEKAMLFDKLGVMGNAMNTLQTFPINWYQQWNWAAREAGRGNPLPAATMFAVQAYVAGAMGVPGFSDMDKLWNGLKGLMADHSPKMWDKVKDVDLKQIVMNSLGKSGLYGGLSEQSGVGVTSRASAPAGSEMIAAPFGPAADIGRQSVDAFRAITSPMDSQKRAQAMLSIAPSGLQGALETGPLKDQTSVVSPATGQRIYGSVRDLAAREGRASRTPEEETLRAWGLRSQREVVERDQTFRNDTLNSQAQKVISSLPNRIYNELRKNNMDEAKDLIGLYAKLSGKSITEQQIASEAQKEYTTSAQRSMMNATTVPGMLAIKRLQQLQQSK